MTHTDAVKISDFGTSKELCDKSTKMSFAGTVAWMAPEVIRNEPVSEKVDIWWVELPGRSPAHFRLISALPASHFFASHFRLILVSHYLRFDPGSVLRHLHEYTELPGKLEFNFEQHLVSKAL